MEGEIAVRVEGAVDGSGIGVSVLDGGTGRHLAYEDLEGMPLPAELEFTGIPEGEHQVRLVRSPAEAAHGYLDRVAVVVPSRSQVGRPTLSARVQELRIQLSCPSDPSLVARSLVSLTRVDDPHWRPLQRSRATALRDPMLMADGDGLLRLRGLGPGHYALELAGLVWEGEAPRFQFRVPGPERLEATFRPR